MSTVERKQRLEGLSEKIFLDRYAWKDADSNNAKVGDVVLVLTKDDPKFPTRSRFQDKDKLMKKLSQILLHILHS